MPAEKRPARGWSETMVDAAQIDRDHAHTHSETHSEHVIVRVRKRSSDRTPRKTMNTYKPKNLFHVF